MLKSVLMLMAVGAGAAGCVDAKGSFDQFADRVGFTDASTIDRTAGQLHDISGTFLYVTRAGFETSNNPDFYIQFIARIQMTITGDTASLTGSLTPLCTYETCANRYEIPPALPATASTVASDGTFASGFGGTLPSGANPFSGTDQPLQTTTDGTIFSPDFFCGSVAGTAAGLDLAGSTFAATRITDVTPANLPNAPAACPTGGQDAGVDAPPIDAPPIDAPPVDAAVDATVDAPTDAEIDAI